MNLVTIIWSSIAAVCLTLAAMNLLVWLNKRTDLPKLLFSVLAAATAATAFFEQAMMAAGTTEEYGRFMWWVQLPVWLVVVSLVLFMRQYLQAGRPWLAWAVCGMRTLSLALNFVFSPNLYYREIISLDHLRFLGETISVAKGVPNPWMLTAQVSTLLLVIFAVDVAITVYKRRDSRGAVLLSSTIVFFVTGSLFHAVLVFWWRVPVPVTISFYSLGLVAAIAYEMSRDVQRAAQLSEDLRKNEEALKSSKRDLEQLAGRLISAQEEELRRLSRELHDDLTQRLAVMAIEAGKLELDASKMPGRCAEIAGAAARIKEQLIKVSEDVHTISRQIHPTILDDLGLVRAIESECSSVRGRHPLEISFRNGNVPDEIPDDIALCLYRVVQEGLRNVIAHSAAKNCKILLKGGDHALFLTVTDDGAGFDPLEVRQMPGLGLSSMRERVQLIRGEFAIRSRPGEGAVITVRVPLGGGAA